MKQSIKFFLLFIILLNLKIAFANTLLVTNVLSNSVTLFDETTLKPYKEIPVGYKPHEIEVTPNGKFALVANFGDIYGKTSDDTLTLIDIANKKVAQTIKLAKNSRPHGIKFISDSQALVTAQGIQSLLIVDINSGQVIKTISLPGSGAHMVTVDAIKRYAYVANVDSGTVVKVDLKTFSIIAEIKVGKEAEGIVLTPEEDLLLVTARKDDYVAAIRTKDLLMRKLIKTDSGPVRVELANDGKYAVVTNTISGSAQVIDLAALRIINTFKTSSACSILPVPINILVGDDPTTAYITNSFAGDITLVDLEEGEIIKSFKSGHMPDGLAMTH